MDKRRLQTRWLISVGVLGAAVAVHNGILQRIDPGRRVSGLPYYSVTSAAVLALVAGGLGRLLLGRRAALLFAMVGGSLGSTLGPEGGPGGFLLGIPVGLGVALWPAQFMRRASKNVVSGLLHPSPRKRVLLLTSLAVVAAFISGQRLRGTLIDGAAEGASLLMLIVGCAGTILCLGQLVREFLRKKRVAPNRHRGRWVFARLLALTLVATASYAGWQTELVRRLRDFRYSDANVHSGSIWFTFPFDPPRIRYLDGRLTPANLHTALELHAMAELEFIHFTLDRANSLTSEDEADLERLPVKSLYIVTATEDDLSFFSRLKSLEKLIVVQTSADTLVALRNCPLTQLIIDNLTDTSPAALAPLIHLTRLKKLYLGAPLTSDELATILNLPGLERVRMRLWDFDQLSPDVMKQLAARKGDLYVGIGCDRVNYRGDLAEFLDGLERFREKWPTISLHWKCPLDGRYTEADNTDQLSRLREADGWLAMLRSQLPARLANEQKEVGPVITNSIGMSFVPIPAGRFLMGTPSSDRSAGPEQMPQHEVEISRKFYLGAWEVTKEDVCRVFQFAPTPGGDTPVESIWEFAVGFCQALGDLPAERAAGRHYRLPTEAEWEYACRAGTTTRFSFGDNEASFPPFAWVVRGGLSPNQVGTRNPNPWGLFDMHGNVAEWVADVYDPCFYANSPRVDPTGPVGPATPEVERVLEFVQNLGLSETLEFADTQLLRGPTPRVMRGGGYYSMPFAAASAYRSGSGEEPQRKVAGFRVVCEFESE